MRRAKEERRRAIEREKRRAANKRASSGPKRAMKLARHGQSEFACSSKLRAARERETKSGEQTCKQRPETRHEARPPRAV